jgi:glycosyltransferase involved in cell wall biosynthesis
MEDMTLNMISGDKAFPAKELARLTGHLLKEGKPDIIHISNALVIGLAKQLKSKIDVKIVCSLLNEDDWINDMAEPWQSKAWKLISQEAKHIDAFITPSKYYRDFFSLKTGIPKEKINVVPVGLDPGMLLNVVKKDNWPSLGYFCRMNFHNGFDKLVDAFILLRKQNRVPGLTLRVSGGYTGDDKPFVMEQTRKIEEAGFSDSVTIYPDFLGPSKIDFFGNIDLMSVPVRKYDGYGLYLLEANAAGVPVIQPSTGAFPEIISNTGGGVTYDTDDIYGLADGIEKLIKDRELLSGLGSSGKNNVLTKLSLGQMSQDLYEIYNSAK